VVNETPVVKEILRHIGEQTIELPSAEELDRLGTNGMLALIHDAIGHLVTPVGSLRKAMPIIQEAAQALIEQKMLLKEVLTIRERPNWEHLGACKPEEVSSLPHSVLKPDMRFVSVSASYCDLFEFTAAEFRGISFINLLHPSEVMRFSRTVKPLLKGTAESCEIVQWRVAGSPHFVHTKDTLWRVGTATRGGPQYIATVSERVPDQDDAAKLAERAKLKIHGHTPEQQRE
jgi:hypothetical protein